MSRKQLTIARILFGLYLLAVAWLCFGDFGSMPSVEQSFWGIPTDKIAHFLMFLPYPVLAYLAFNPRSRNGWWSLLWSALAFLTGCALAAGTELLQARFFPYRTGDPADFKADVLALAVSSAAVFLIDLLRQKQCAR